MRPAIVAFAFGVLIFIASTAALALEPPLHGPGHLSLLMLATLAALTGLISIAGAALSVRGDGVRYLVVRRPALLHLSWR
jgi:hypothetical protein